MGVAKMDSFQLLFVPPSCDTCAAVGCSSPLGECSGVNGIFASLSLGLEVPKSGIWIWCHDRDRDLGQRRGAFVLRSALCQRACSSQTAQAPGEHWLTASRKLLHCPLPNGEITVA